MVVAFDYDEVASNERIQKLMRKLAKERNEIWIVTARRENEFSRIQIKPLLQMVGIPEQSVIYCNDKPKLEMLEMINADIYIDNNSEEFENILNHTSIIPLLFNS